jgi:hypothetical protein
MYGELYQYLILHKHLDLPGIGALVVERRPAQIDITEKIIHPPTFSIGFRQQANSPSKSFFNWIGSKFGISERDAVIRFNDFLFELKKELNNGLSLEWAGVGTISKGLGGDFKMVPLLQHHLPAASIPASKVLRENPEHLVRVGEEERTSSQMREYFYHNGNVGRRPYLWTIALVITILSVIFIGFYFSTRGMNTSSASNQQKLVPQPETKTH